MKKTLNEKGVMAPGPGGTNPMPMSMFGFILGFVIMGIYGLMCKIFAGHWPSGRYKGALKYF